MPFLVAPIEPRSLARWARTEFSFGERYEASFSIRFEDHAAILEGAFGKFPIFGRADRDQLIAAVRGFNLGLTHIRWERFAGRDHGGWTVTL